MLPEEVPIRLRWIELPKVVTVWASDSGKFCARMWTLLSLIDPLLEGLGVD